MSSGFVTESDLAEARKRRQEEWEKVRTPDQPLERPEEPYDGRSLYDRLQEQKLKKDMEYEEAHKLKNLIRGLDDDEIQFLEMVDKNKLDAEKKQMLEEEKELNEFRNRVATLQEESVEKQIQSQLKSSKPKESTTSSARPSQKSLLGIGIKRKNGDITNTNGTEKSSTSPGIKPSNNNSNENNGRRELSNINTNEFDRGNLKCVAILPGIGPYYESSDSELSSGSDDSPQSHSNFDLCGRKRHKKKGCDEECI